MDSGVASVTQQLADLAELKVARQRRAQMRRGSPEWLAALGIEEGLIDPDPTLGATTDCVT